MAMKIKNYTTTINAEKTIMEVEKLLIGFGATTIMKDYSGDEKVRALAFRFQEKGYKIPIHVEGVRDVMYAGRQVGYGVDAEKKRYEQAYKTAWRIVKDWLHAQLSIIVSGQAEPDEVLLPYLWDGKKTLYQAYKDGQIKLEGYSETD